MLEDAILRGAEVRAVLWIARYAPRHAVASAKTYSIFLADEDHDDWDDPSDKDAAAVLDWLLRHRPPATPEAVEIVTRRIPANAAERCWMSVLAVILERGYPVDLTRLWDNLPWRPRLVGSGGLVASIAWLGRHGVVMTRELFAKAAAAGNYAVVRWLRDSTACPGFDTVAAEVVGALDSPEVRDYLAATLAQAGRLFETYLLHAPTHVHTAGLLL